MENAAAILLPEDKEKSSHGHALSTGAYRHQGKNGGKGIGQGRQTLGDCRPYINERAAERFSGKE
jgi:hypothetical protein